MEETNIILQDDTNNAVPKKEKAFEKNKKRVYADERTDVLTRLYAIIGITDTNKEFYSDSFDDETIIQSILELEGDIIKYFNVSGWPAFKKMETPVAKRPLSIVKSLLKDMNVNYNAVNLRIRKNPKEQPVNITQYKLV
jgi:hypothetical protein